MRTRPNADSLESLLERGAWAAARDALAAELHDDPDNHWLRTQFGVTLYEEGRYAEALDAFRSSLAVVPDCPLTLWNVAGAFDALGRPADAVPVYAWLVRTARTAADDPCWESAEWAAALKADCVYRLAGCVAALGDPAAAERCYRQYLDLLLAGIGGTYSADDAAARIRKLRPADRPLDKALRAGIDATLARSGIPVPRSRRAGPPKIGLAGPPLK